MFFFRLLARTSLRTRSVASRVETPEALTSFKKHTRLEVQRCGLVWYALSRCHAFAPTNIPELLERALRPHIESGLAGTLV